MQLAGLAFRRLFRFLFIVSFTSTALEEKESFPVAKFLRETILNTSTKIQTRLSEF